MSLSVRVLHLDDDLSMIQKTKRALSGVQVSGQSFEYQGTSSLEVFETLLQNLPDCFLLDISMGDNPEAGLEVLEDLRSRGVQKPIVMMSSLALPEVIQAALQQGASDFVTKGMDEPELAFRLVHCVETYRKAEVSSGPLKGLAAGRTIREIEMKLARVQESPIRSVLVMGESGTGKEVVADRLHAMCLAGTPFVRVNCASIAKDLIESELFGHEKGAFTGANNIKTGLFSAADGGWIFLDEVARLSMACQASLLRTLESGEIRPVGSSVSRFVKVKVISATNEDLDDLVRKGEFRSDLLARLRSYEINIPPLRERPAEEVSEILDALLSRINLEHNRPSHVLESANSMLVSPSNLQPALQPSLQVSPTGTLISRRERNILARKAKKDESLVLGSGSSSRVEGGVTQSVQISAQGFYKMVPSVRQLFLSHSWQKSNVREMFQTLLAASVEATEGLITLGCLPKSFLTENSQRKKELPSLLTLKNLQIPLKFTVLEDEFFIETLQSVFEFLKTKQIEQNIEISSKQVAQNMGLSLHSFRARLEKAANTVDLNAEILKLLD